MSLIIETDLKEFLSNLERKIDQRFDKIDHRLDTMQEDITTLKLGQNDARNEIKLVQTKLEGDIKSLDTKGSVIQQGNYRLDSNLCGRNPAGYLQILARLILFWILRMKSSLRIQIP